MNGSRAIKLAKIVLTTVVVVVAVGAAMLTVIVPRVTGSVSLTVLTGSMSPTIPAGSVVLVKPLEPTEIEKGDVVTFQSAPGKSSYITHRVVDIENENGQLSFITKGDANRGADLDPVPAGAVRGRVIFHVPYVGRLADTVRSPLGALGLVGIPCAVYIVFQARELRKQHRLKRGVTVHASAEPDLAPGAMAATPNVARALLMASAQADPAGRRDLTLLAAAFGGSVVDARDDRIVLMVVGAPNLLDEAETQLRLRHSCAIRRSPVVSFDVADLEQNPDEMPVAVNGSHDGAANGYPFETVPLPQPACSRSERLRRASADLRRLAAPEAPAQGLTLHFTDRARAVSVQGADDPSVSSTLRQNGHPVDA